MSGIGDASELQCKEMYIPYAFRGMLPSKIGVAPENAEAPHAPPKA